jgi:hypothetical protein
VGELEAEAFGLLEAVAGGAARADDAEGGAVAGFDFAPDVEEEGSVVEVAEALGPCFVLRGEEVVASVADALEFSGDIAMVLPCGEDGGGFLADAVDSEEFAAAGGENGCGGSAGSDETADADWADFRQHIEGEERLCFRHG